MCPPRLGSAPNLREIDFLHFFLRSRGNGGRWRRRRRWRSLRRCGFPRAAAESPSRATSMQGDATFGNNSLPPPASRLQPRKLQRKVLPCRTKYQIPPYPYPCRRHPCLSHRCHHCANTFSRNVKRRKHRPKTVRPISAVSAARGEA